MDISSVQENCQTGGSPSPKQRTSELMHEFGPESISIEPGEQKHGTAENVRKGSAEEARIIESNSISVEQLRLPEDSTKNSSCELLRPPPDDATVSSMEQMKLVAESVTRKISSPKRTKSEQDHEFGSESVDIEQLEQKQVVDTDNVQNGPVEIQKAECDHIGFEVPPLEEATRKRPSSDDLTMKCSLEKFGLPYEDATTNSNLEQSGQVPDAASKNPSREQLESMQEDADNNPAQLGLGEKRISVQPREGKSTLRSLVGSTRVLRSRLQDKSKAPEPSNNFTEDGGKREKKRKKKKQMKKNPVNEFSRIRRHFRYLLTRMKYEQNLIEAYSGEGWKGQSLEKIKPEKELQRAKSEILRCKLKIRDLFQRLDASCDEGRLPESLFDSQGEIDSEDIFCAKCRSKDLPVNNDIILCDGACERGFHQFCLEPPMLKENIPRDDEGWLCPGCDCKVDCTDLLNDSQGTNLSISDSWKKVFPEAAAGNKLDDTLGVSSDDSEDYDYDPNGAELDEKVQGDESSSDTSDFSSASDDLEALPNSKQYLGLPSDDSEDDDYNPNAPDLDEQAKQESSSSDFTSDSEEFSVVFDENKPLGEVQGLLSVTSPHTKSNGESKLSGKKRQSLSGELLSLLDSDPTKGDSAPLSGKRHVERLDYKKLHDETYGNVSSDSSDEDYMDTAALKKRKNNAGKVASASPNGKTPVVKHGTDAKDMEHNQRESDTPKRTPCKNPDVEGSSNSPAKSHNSSSGPRSSGKSTSRPSEYKKLGEAVIQRLSESFKGNQYPERAVKENLAKEVALTVSQVSKWFENARWRFHHPSRKESSMAESAPDKGSTSIKNELPGRKPIDPGCNSLEKREPTEASPDTIECCSGDARTGNLATEESNGQKYRKRELKLDQQTTVPSSSMQEKPKQSAQVNSPNAQEVRRSGRIQSRSRKPAS